MLLHKRFYLWKTAGLLALCLCLGLGLWAERRQAALADRLVRLHVIASSDSAADQAEKLRVRDAVLAMLSSRLEAAPSAAEAARTLRSALPEVAALAEELTGRPARAELGREAYPTRRYEDFALPAGTYTSLRVTLGEGAGRNWWCVVYPPLCLSAAGARPAAALSEDDRRLISGQDGETVIKFRVIEWWETLTGRGGA